uniref:Small ribosomal subunit protein mS41 SAM domain-containing protein n=1 Tax=Chenopodium quinoa TaxID=63459 RepID=A0A803MQX1_CHEQI
MLRRSVLVLLSTFLLSLSISLLRSLLTLAMLMLISQLTPFVARRPFADVDDYDNWCVHLGVNSGAQKFAIEGQAFNEATFCYPDELGPDDVEISNTRQNLTLPCDHPFKTRRTAEGEHVKVKVLEFLNRKGKGVEAHVGKLEFGDLQKLLVVRTLKLKKLEIPCKHELKLYDADSIQKGVSPIEGTGATMPDDKDDPIDNDGNLFDRDEAMIEEDVVTSVGGIRLGDDNNPSFICSESMTCVSAEPDNNMVDSVVGSMSHTVAPRSVSKPHNGSQPDVDVTQEGGEGGNGSSGECLDWDDVIPQQPSQPVLDPTTRKRKWGRPKCSRNKPPFETIRGSDVDVTQEGGEGGNGNTGECLDWDDVIP